jgi:nucleoid-associated protein YgaU
MGKDAHMRNDVKLGFAIGGVLLAVLIVYVLVVPGGSNGTKSAKVDSKKTDHSKVTLEPLAPPAATQASAPPSAPAGVFTPPAALGATSQPTEVASNDGETDAAAKVVDPPAPSKAKDLDWSKLLNSPTLMSETPTPAGQTRVGQGGEGKAVESVTPAPEPKEAPYKEIVRDEKGGVHIYPPPDLSDSKSEPKVTSPLSPSTRSSVASGGASGGASGSHTHRIAQYETLSTIAAAAYGNQNLWPAIVKANAGLDANRMKVGQVINLPDITDAKPAQTSTVGAQTASAKQSAAPIDSRKQYRVQSNDSLYKISVKLYGKGTYADKIYEANKSRIGEDPAKLKVGQVLQLPEPPTVTSAR